jgi:lysozyme
MKLPLVLTALVLGAGCSSTSAPENACTGNSGEALTVCAAGPTVKGVDVSVYQGTVNWKSVKASGRAFAFARVSDGLDYPDSKFDTNWAGIKAAGLLRGAYQFFRPGQDPTKQADMFVAKMGTLGEDDLPPVMDMEVTDGQSPATIQAHMKTWLARVELKTGRKPLIYTAAFMSGNVGNGFTGYPLWVANYGATCPLMPANFTSWKFWQSSSTGSVSGISGDVDLDEFNGNLTALTKLANPGGGASDAGAHDAGTHDAGPPPEDAGAPEPEPQPTSDGDNGQTMGSGNGPPSAGGDPSADPCH